MPHVLIIESNPAGLSAGLKRMTGATYGETYAAVLQACRSDIRATVCAPYDGEALPDLTSVDAVAFTGSGVSWSTQDPRVEPLAQAMRDVFAAGLPVVGSCNGMQLAASLLGGRCEASPHGNEEGLARDIRLTEAGRVHPLMAGRRDGFAAPCIHRDEVTTLPEGAVLLAGNAHSPVQAFAYEQGGIRFWGMQYHPEMSLSFIADLLAGLGRIEAPEAQALRDAHAAPCSLNAEDLAPQMLRCELRNWAQSL
jgi:GMP synthase (glutamine-hydrolysing)